MEATCSCNVLEARMYMTMDGSDPERVLALVEQAVFSVEWQLDLP